MSEQLSIKTNLSELCEIAIKNGATDAKILSTEEIIVDRRVRLKCLYPRCGYYGQNLMCPPFTPTPEEFKEYLSSYQFGILVQLIEPISEKIQELFKNEDASYAELMEQKESRILLDEWKDTAWKKLNQILAAVETEAFSKGFPFATGFGAMTCRLCKKCDPKLPCKHPWESRASIEAVGIDVYKTVMKAGMEFHWSTKSESIFYGLILID